MKSPLAHLILALGICVVVIVGYGFGYSAIAAKSASVAALQKQIDTKTATVSRANTTRTALAEIAGDEAVVQSYFVPETGVVAFIDGLEAQGRSLGSTLSVLSVSTGDVPGQPTLILTLTIAGTFDAVMRTLGAIEYAPYAISVSTLSVNQDGKDSWHADLKILVGSSVAEAATSTP